MAIIGVGNRVLSTVLRTNWLTVVSCSLPQIRHLAKDDTNRPSSSSDGTVEQQRPLAEAEPEFTSIDGSPDSRMPGGLDKAFKMFHRVEQGSGSEPVPDGGATKSPSFASLLRNSKLMQIGDPEGRVVVGTIIEILDEDLYIDFGGKFHCVCKKPRTRGEEYHRGSKVKIRLHDLEMSSRFLGGERDITLLEADATLIGLHRVSRVGHPTMSTRRLKSME